MYTVVNNTNTLEIKKSKFITLIYNVNSIDDINEYLKIVKDTYKGATHYCYAYILDNIKKESDDNEPSGTAGVPILQVLEKNNLINTLCIVVRYFGGIKLGAGGLIRAYTKSATECIKNNIKELIKGYNITIIFDYNQIKDVDYILSSEEILNKSFNKRITYTLNVKEDVINKLNNINDISININKDIYM